MTTSKNVGIDYPPVRFNYLENVYVKSNNPIEVHDLREISDLKDKFHGQTKEIEQRCKCLAAVIDEA